LLIVAAGVVICGRPTNGRDADLDQDLAMTEEAASVPDDAAVYVPAIVDLAGDPMADTGSKAARQHSFAPWLGLRNSALSTSPPRSMFCPTRCKPSERFMTTIPSSQEDFAFFEAQKGAGGLAPADDRDVIRIFDLDADAATAPAAGASWTG
jgi:hypothetical protein